MSEENAQHKYVDPRKHEGDVTTPHLPPANGKSFGELLAEIAERQGAA